MSVNYIESIPQTWDDKTDTAFFTIVARLFTPEFTYGASVLLATYDVTDDVAANSVSALIAAAAAPDMSAEFMPASLRRS
jgi:hypothetical protein